MSKVMKRIILWEKTYRFELNTIIMTMWWNCEGTDKQSGYLCTVCVLELEGTNYSKLQLTSFATVEQTRTALNGNTSELLFRSCVSKLAGAYSKCTYKLCS